MKMKPINVGIVVFAAISLAIVGVYYQSSNDSGSESPDISLESNSQGQGVEAAVLEAAEKRRAEKRARYAQMTPDELKNEVQVIISRTEAELKKAGYKAEPVTEEQRAEIDEKVNALEAKIAQIEDRLGRQ